MATMSPSATKEQARQHAAQMQQLFASWKSPAATNRREEASNIFMRVIAASGATFQRMLSDRSLMEEVMENELNVAETCIHLMDSAELSQRRERANSMSAEQQALLRAAVQESEAQRKENKDPAYSMMLNITDAAQMETLMALYGPSFV